MDLVQWRKHIDAVVKSEGQWLGVADENGYPIYEIGGLVSHTFPTSHLAESSVEVVLNVSPGDRVLDDLVGEGLGVQDAEGRLVPASGPTRLLLLVRDGLRLAATVTHTVVSGRSAPSQIVVHGVGLSDGLGWWPCPSVPLSWTQGTFTQFTTDASGIEYKLPRDLAQVAFATRADGYTKKGPAATIIRELVEESFRSVNALMGWGDPHAVVEFLDGEDTSPEVLIRVNDDPLWDTIAEPARIAGLSVVVSLWWPGDDPVRVKTASGFEATSFTYPVQVVRVREVG